MEKYVLSFKEIDKTSLPYVGGKGANLGEMTKGGFPIPQGFCVTTWAYRAFIQQSREISTLLDQLVQLNPEDLEQIRELGKRIREHLQSLSMPKDIKACILEAFQAAGKDKAYAVRSSATAEDLPILEEAQTLKDKGILREKEDVFYLTLDELIALDESKYEGSTFYETTLNGATLKNATFNMTSLNDITSKETTSEKNTSIFSKTLWIVMSISAISLLYFISISHLFMFNLLNAIIGLCVGGIMSTFMINSQNAVESKDRTVLSGLIQLGRYMGASVGVTFFAGVLPDLSLINSVMEFTGAFGLLVGLSVLGFVNEMI
ncbi:MAG: hypothetical protein GX958_00675 [Desulfitobacterium sp.]|nr:hypothetical protein [Desulfitobacterium sp.]